MKYFYLFRDFVGLRVYKFSGKGVRGLGLDNIEMIIDFRVVARSFTSISILIN